ncbi:alpha/beta hydrolase [Sphingomonas solaris]|uniref:Alpha/beta hydrolase n=1 Tax=Alterirhizorhabdus solaris TaxID=2529389 RepID=A0A558RB81_9SPHN|nr:alpha/beta hydrolase [Sphingomonas solaris]TVV76611.1 alpha/beta hydrolase [Sphingomonas solaris]
MSRLMPAAALCMVPAAFAPVAAAAQDVPAANGVRTLAPIRLYPGAAPGTPPATQAEAEDRMGPLTVLRNVSVPTVTPVLPAPGKANGAAVVIAPGGGYRILAIDIEGYQEARWLAARGISAFVLKYRVMPVTGSLADMAKQAVANMPPASQSAYVTFDYPPAVADAANAVRLVRRRAGEWGVDPRRIGLMGFSAGAISTVRVATDAGITDRPDFVAAIYPPLEAVAVPADAPPLFGAIALDDPLFAGKGFGLIDAWRKAKRPVEFHLYETGGHGFGMGRPGTTTGDWLASFHGWMTMRKLVPGAAR